MKIHVVFLMKKYLYPGRAALLQVPFNTHCNIESSITASIDPVWPTEAFIHRVWIVLYKAAIDDVTIKIKS